MKMGVLWYIAPIVSLEYTDVSDVRTAANIIAQNTLFTNKQINASKPKLVSVIFRHSVRTSQKTEHFAITKIN
jgi:uncharacterized protein YegJ (DUF2314 family)